METYNDELILLDNGEAIENVVEENRHKNDINDGYIIIDEETIEFSERCILEEKVFMIIPTSFDIMVEEDIEVKYPLEDRPQVIFTNLDTSINITISQRRDQILQNDQVEALKNIIQDNVKEEHSDLKLIGDGVFCVEENNIAYFDFMSSAVDSEMYNLLYVLSLDSTLILGSFNCIQEYMADWKDIFLQMLQSTRLVKGVDFNKLLSSNNALV